jgi:hypothetical protein
MNTIGLSGATACTFYGSLCIIAVSRFSDNLFSFMRLSALVTCVGGT